MNQEDIALFTKKLKETKPLSMSIKGSRNNAPRPVNYHNSKKQFIPDVVVSYTDKRDFYVFEREINKDDIALLTFKWILFSSEARKFNGTFFLVVDKTNSIYCKKVLLNQKLDLTLIEL